MPCRRKLEETCETHPADVSRPELDGAEQAEDDHDDVDEVGQDGSPLVPQEVDYLPLQHADLVEIQEETLPQHQKAITSERRNKLNSSIGCQLCSKSLSFFFIFSGLC